MSHKYINVTPTESVLLGNQCFLNFKGREGDRDSSSREENGTSESSCTNSDHKRGEYSASHLCKNTGFGIKLS